MFRSTSFRVARLVACLTGAEQASASLALAEPQVPPVYQLLRSFGEPPTGSHPSPLIQGSDGALYGAAADGGKYGDGTVFKLNPDGSGFTVLLNEIDSYTGLSPNGVIQGTDGALYGTTRRDSILGDGGYGNVFKLNTDGSGYFNLYQFDDFTTGAYPTPGLIQGTDSALYGTASGGGSSGYGTVFKFDLSNQSMTVLLNFSDSTTGAFPRTGVIQGTDGLLYGTTNFGGSNGHGTLFKLNTDGSGVTVLLNFDESTTGVNAVLIERTDGTLYGTTSSGGSNGQGTLFKLNRDGSGFTVLLDFDDSTTGGYPGAGLIEGTDGLLFGTTATGGIYGYGTLFRFDTDGSDFTVLSNFDDSTTGGYPSAGLMEGTDGLLYGSTTSGGGNGWGTLFKLESDGSGFVDLHDLIGITGINPVAGLTQATDGALYGTTLNGGSGKAFIWDNGTGTLFKLNPDGTLFSNLFDFDATSYDSTSGVHPAADLIQASDGNLYGTCLDFGKGSATGFGTVFGWDLSYGLHQISGAVYPRAGVIQGMDGALYGTSSDVGDYVLSSYGTVFKVNLDGSGWTLLLQFDKSTTGAYPYAALIQGTDGTLYGTASAGGSAGYGTVFKLNPDGTGVTVLLNFDATTTGANPLARLIQGTDGALYGTASRGGSAGYGTVFKLDPDGTGFAVLQNFDGTTSGATPDAGLMQGTDGALYGTVSHGGSYGFGTVFRLNTDGSGFTVLLNFDGATTGAYPSANLIRANDGNLYGTTSAGGSFDGGTVFRLIFNASWSNYGTGFAGTHGIPNLVSSANPVLGTTITLTIDNSLGSDATGFLIMGLSQTSIPFKQGTVLVNFFHNWSLVLPLLSMPAAGKKLDAAIPDDDSLYGLVLDVQVLELDPGAAQGVSFTPGLNLMLGR